MRKQVESKTRQEKMEKHLTLLLIRVVGRLIEHPKVKDTGVILETNKRIALQLKKIN